MVGWHGKAYSKPICELALYANLTMELSHHMAHVKQLLSIYNYIDLVSAKDRPFLWRYNTANPRIHHNHGGTTY